MPKFICVLKWIVCWRLSGIISFYVNAFFIMWHLILKGTVHHSLKIVFLLEQPKNIKKNLPRTWWKRILLTQNLLFLLQQCYLFFSLFSPFISLSHLSSFRSSSWKWDLYRSSSLSYCTVHGMNRQREWALQFNPKTSRHLLQVERERGGGCVLNLTWVDSPEKATTFGVHSWY